MSGIDIIIWEALGTAVLILLGTSSVANTVLPGSGAKGLGANWTTIVLGWGFGVFAGVTVAAPSGSHLNPAVTLGLALSDLTPWSQVPAYVTGQLVGAFVGAVLCYLVFKLLFDANEDNSGTRGIFCTAPAVRSYGWNVVTEAIATLVLMLWVLTNTDMNAGLGATGVAWVVVAIGFAMGGVTGYAINPARDLGPRIAYALLPIKGKGDVDWAYSWVPVVGPLAGASLAALLVSAL